MQGLGCSMMLKGIKKVTAMSIPCWNFRQQGNTQWRALVHISHNRPSSQGRKGNAKSWLQKKKEKQTKKNHGCGNGTAGVQLDSPLDSG